MIYNLDRFNIPSRNCRGNHSLPVTTNGRMIIRNTLLNRLEFEKTLWTKKLCLVHSFPMTYHFLNADIRLKSNRENTVRPFLNTSEFSVYSKLFKICMEFEKTQNMKKMWNFIIFPTPYYLHHSGQPFVNWVQNTFRSCIDRILYFKIKWKSCIISENLQSEKVADFQYLSNGIL